MQRITRKIKLGLPDWLKELLTKGKYSIQSNVTGEGNTYAVIRNGVKVIKPVSSPSTKPNIATSLHVYKLHLGASSYMFDPDSVQIIITGNNDQDRLL